MAGPRSVPRDRRADRARAAAASSMAPLYPQYCAATTATVVDAVNATILKTLRWQPDAALRAARMATIPPISAALKASVDARARRARFRRPIVLRRELSRHAREDVARWAIPIIVQCQRDRAPARRRRSPAPSRWRSSRASDGPNGWSPRPTRRLARLGPRRASASRSSRPGSRPTASRRSRSSRSAARISSRRRAATRFAYLRLPQRRRSRGLAMIESAGAARTRGLALKRCALTSCLGPSR
jgi:hypothetical protein